MKFLEFCRIRLTLFLCKQYRLHYFELNRFITVFGPKSNFTFFLKFIIKDCLRTWELTSQQKPRYNKTVKTRSNETNLVLDRGNYTATTPPWPAIAASVDLDPVTVTAATWGRKLYPSPTSGAARVMFGLHHDPSSGLQHHHHQHNHHQRSIPGLKEETVVDSASNGWISIDHNKYVLSKNWKYFKLEKNPIFQSVTSINALIESCC